MSDSEGVKGAKNTPKFASKPSASGQSTPVSSVPKVRLTQTPGWKFILTGIITILLLIPALLVWGLVEERADRADEVARSIASGWGEPQQINGPYLVIPYLETRKVQNEFKEFREYAIFSPEKLAYQTDIDAQERTKSIYSTLLYNLKAKMSGHFAKPDLAALRGESKRFQINDAFIAVEVSDLAGFRADVSATLNGKEAGEFKPGMQGLHPSRNGQYPKRNQPGRSVGGIHLPVSETDMINDLAFEIDLSINGSRQLSIVPSGKSTSISMESNWPHPGFDGRFLPERRELSEAGFNATWSVPNLARGIDGLTLSSALSNADAVVKVNFVKPLKFYQLVSRTLKYAVAFFSLVFLAMFILELSKGHSVHWIQYILTGLAMIVFYILLLALAEQIGFDLAYLVAATATTLLIAWYVGNALGSKKGMGLMGAVIGLTYAIMYLVLKEDEYALLIGSLIAFAAIALTMFATRNVDWNKTQQA